MKKKNLKLLCSLVAACIGASAPLACPNNYTEAVAATSALGFPVYVNGQAVQLENAIIVDGRTYVQLRELCGKVNVDVDWIDPRYHMAPSPGGNMLEGINLTAPTFVYTQTITKASDRANKFEAVEITGLKSRYTKDKGYKYYFDNGNFVNDSVEVKTETPVDIVHSNGRDYVSVEEFKEKIQPYLTDMCMQEFQLKDEIGTTTSTFKYDVYANGRFITLGSSIIENDRTYVQLRETCEKLNLDVDWIDPRYHTLPIPGGNLPDGINITVPTYVYTKSVPRVNNTSELCPSVEITGLKNRYKSNMGYKYYFDNNTFVTEINGEEVQIEFELIRNMGRYYVPIKEFKEKIQPYLTDMCMQNIK
ncbi:MAG: hypothetical protein ACI4LO_06450 [Anaerovoracaceae bacterium]